MLFPSSFSSFFIFIHEGIPSSVASLRGLGFSGKEDLWAICRGLFRADLRFIELLWPNEIITFYLLY